MLQSDGCTCFDIHMQVLECYALNEVPPEEVQDLTQPDIEGMSKQAGKIIAFKVSSAVRRLGYE